MRTRSQYPSQCDFFTELMFYYRRHLQAAEMEIGGASEHLMLAADIAKLGCDHWTGCPTCRRASEAYVPPPVKVQWRGVVETRHWIGIPSFAGNLTPRLGHCWIARLILSKGKFIRPRYSTAREEWLLKEHLLHCQTCDPTILSKLIGATPGIRNACLSGQTIILYSGFPFAIGPAFREHAEHCDVCSISAKAAQR